MRKQNLFFFSVKLNDWSEPRLAINSIQSAYLVYVGATGIFVF